MRFKWFWIDLFFLISGVIGVGFATGKEIAHFFLGGKYLYLAVAMFFVVFAGLSMYILYIKRKYNINDLTRLNKLAFGKNYEIGNIVLLVLFIVTNAAMLAGCDNIVQNYLGINIPIASLILSAITFFIVLGGVDRIKLIANIIMPLLIVVIIVNACFNIETNVSMNGKISLDLIYPIIFCSENFITLISVLIKTKSKPKMLSITSGIIISIIVLLSALAIGNLDADMPMLSLSKNISKWFFAIYLSGVIFALFTTLEISAYHSLEVSIEPNAKKYFPLIIIILISQIVAYLGFNFIVKYLYSGIGILGAVYLIALIIRLIIMDKNNK